MRAAIFVPLLVAAIALHTSQTSSPAVSVSLLPHSGSGVRGVASIRAAGAGTSVVLHVHGLHGGALAEAFLRKGDCTRPGVRVLVLPKLKANRKGEATARGAIHSRAGHTLSYAKVTNGTYVLTIEPGRGVAACGEVAKDRSTTLPPAAGKGTGGSTATCQPAPCTPGVPQQKAVRANDGSGYDVKFWYAVIRPGGLANSPSNRAPLLIQFRGMNDTYWASYAATNRFVVIDVPPGPNCPGTSGKCTGYMIRTISPNAANVRPLNTCGPPPAGQPYGAGNGPCDLKYELKAILDREISAQNIDASKVFVTGSSAGGTATEDAICDPLISHYFRGAFLISANFFAGKKVSGTASLSNSPPLCPALTVPPINDDISVKYIHGTNDQAIVDNGHVDNWPDGTSSWYYSQLQDLVNFWNPALGCTTHTTTTFGAPNAANRRDTFSSCRRAHRATQLDTISGGNHGCPNTPGLDGFNGSDCRVEGWTFLESH